MKRIVFMVMVILMLTATYGFAQTGGAQSSAIMSREMMHNMTNMMQQMNELMQKLSHPMGHMTVTEHAEMNKMGRIMRDMASQMNEMAAHMEKGSMDPDAVKKMQARMKSISQAIEDLQKK